MTADNTQLLGREKYHRQLKNDDHDRQLLLNCYIGPRNYLPLRAPLFTQLHQRLEGKA
jgi:hypothetical protein